MKRLRAATPRISVLMSVHNGAPYLEQALQSLWQQTFSEYEIVVVDDGSSDDTAQILNAHESFGLRVVRLSKRHGLPRALNIGLDNCRGELIARMDADDIAHPERLATQMNFMIKNPRVVVLGTWMTCVDLFGNETSWQAPVDHEGIISELLFRSPIAHPTAMLRKKTLEKYGIRYDTTFTCSQDYDLWVRLSQHGKLANIDRPLLRFRIHDQSVSNTMRREQEAHARRIRRRMFKSLGFHSHFEQETLHEQIIALESFNKEEFRKAAIWLEMLDQRNKDLGFFPVDRFSKVVKGYLRVLAKQSKLIFHRRG